MRELGFANLAIGTLGVASPFAKDFILPVSIAGAIFYGLAGAAHAFRRGKSAREWAAMITGLLVFSILALNVFGRLAALTVD